MALPTLEGAFPALDRVAYLNAGSCGPTPAASVGAMEVLAGDAAANGRGLAYYDVLGELKQRARDAWAALFGAPSTDIALTAGASDGIARTLALLDWTPGDEVVTSDGEHPGVLGPLGALARRHGVRVVVAPWADLAGAVTEQTKLIVASHVGWLGGQVAELDALPAAGIPIVLDAAQSAGAIPVELPELRRLGVVAYAAAGQKWTCGPVGTGALWLDPDWAPDGGVGVWPTYDNLADPSSGLDAQPWPDARRLDTPSINGEVLAGGLAALELLASAGWEAVHRTGIDGARRLAETLRSAGRDVNTRGATTLVSWRSDDPEADVARASAAGVVIRGFAGQPWVRASVGAWTTNAHVDRLLEVAAG